MRSGGKLFRSFVAWVLCASMLTGIATEGAAARQPEAKDSTAQSEPFEQPGEAGGNLEEDANQEKPAGKPGVNESNPDEAELGEPVVVGEYYKIYRMDETHYRTVYTSEPQAYLTEDGTLAEIDNTLVKDSAPAVYSMKALPGIGEAIPEIYTNKSNSIRVTLPEEMTSARGVRFEKDGNLVELIPQEGDYSRSEVEENAILYGDVYDGIAGMGASAVVTPVSGGLGIAVSIAGVTASAALVGASVATGGAIMAASWDNIGPNIQKAINAGENSSNPKSVEDLINESKPGRATKGKSSQYDKTGDFNKAMEDFESLNPSNVRKSGDTIIGELPDGKTVNVRPKSSEGSPTLEVYDPSNHSHIKFRYK